MHLTLLMLPQDTRSFLIINSSFFLIRQIMSEVAPLSFYPFLVVHSFAMGLSLFQYLLNQQQNLSVQAVRLISNFHLDILLQIVYFKSQAVMQKNSILLNNHQFFPIISSFLNQTDRLSFHSISRTVRQITSSFSFWPVIELSNINQSASALGSAQLNHKMQWAFKSLRQFKPRMFTIFLHEVEQQILVNLVNLMMQGPMESVTTLDIYCESDDVHLACSLSFPNLQQLTVRSKCVTNELAEFMAENLNNLDSLVVIKNDVEFTCKKLSKYIKKPMKKLVVKPYIIDFDEIQKIAEHSANTLTEIEIDVEECSQENFTNILKPLRKLEKLRLYHLQNFDSDKELVESLSTSTSRISELALTKAYSMPLSKVIHTTSTKFLQSLDITDSKFMNDQDMRRVAQYCSNLREVNVSWCNCVTSEGLKALFNGCMKLEKVDITGVKESKDIIFGQYNDLLKAFDSQKFSTIRNAGVDDPSLVEDKKIYDQNFFFTAAINLSDIKILRRLKHLDCQNCNGISDNILKIIYLVNRRARIFNYYGNYMGLFVKDDESTFC